MEQKEKGSPVRQGWMDGWMDEWMDGWMDGWLVGWMVGWMVTAVGGSGLVVVSYQSPQRAAQQQQLARAPLSGSDQSWMVGFPRRAEHPWPPVRRGGEGQHKTGGGCQWVCQQLT